MKKCTIYLPDLVVDSLVNACKKNAWIFKIENVDPAEATKLVEELRNK